MPATRLQASQSGFDGEEELGLFSRVRGLISAHHGLGQHTSNVVPERIWRMGLRGLSHAQRWREWSNAVRKGLQVLQSRLGGMSEGPSRHRCVGQNHALVAALLRIWAQGFAQQFPQLSLRRRVSQSSSSYLLTAIRAPGQTYGCATSTAMAPSPLTSG